MHIAAWIIFILTAVITAIDFHRTNKELRTCPNCKTVVKKKFKLMSNGKQFFFKDVHGKRTTAIIYKCKNCGTSWNVSTDAESTSA